MKILMALIICLWVAIKSYGCFNAIQSFFQSFGASIKAFLITNYLELKYILCHWMWFGIGTQIAKHSTVFHVRNGSIDAFERVNHQIEWGNICFFICSKCLTHNYQMDCIKLIRNTLSGITMIEYPYAVDIINVECNFASIEIQFHHTLSQYRLKMIVMIYFFQKHFIYIFFMSSLICCVLSFELLNSFSF